MFSPKLQKSLPKTIFHKNVLFQAETNVFHKLALLDNFWPIDNLDVITFLRFFLQNCSNHCQKEFFTKTYVFKRKRTFSTNLHCYIMFDQMIILM